MLSAASVAAEYSDWPGGLGAVADILRPRNVHDVTTSEPVRREIAACGRLLQLFATARTQSVRWTGKKKAGIE
jgi:hypothetical protein